LFLPINLFYFFFYSVYYIFYIFINLFISESYDFNSVLVKKDSAFAVFLFVFRQIMYIPIYLNA